MQSGEGSVRVVFMAGLSAVVGTACYVPDAGGHRQEVGFYRGVPVVDVWINGEAVRCVIDTGDPGFSVSPRFGGTPGTLLTEPEVVDVELVFAAWAFTGGAYTLSDAYFERVAGEIGSPQLDCVLGAGVLSVIRLTVDPAGGMIDAADPSAPLSVPRGTERDPFVFEPLFAEGLFVGSVGLQDDFEGVLMLSTGVPGVHLTSTAVEDLAEPPPTSEVDGLQVGRLSSVSVGEFREESVAFQVRDDLGYEGLRRFVGLRVDGALGAALLNQHVSTWDYEAGVVELRAYSESVQEDQRASLNAEFEAAGW